MLQGLSKKAVMSPHCLFPWIQRSHGNPENTTNGRGMVTQSRMEGPWKHFGNIGFRSLPDTTCLACCLVCVRLPIRQPPLYHLT
ncbi:hypothetical protein QR685DRAFT_255109 [Neurospora intermedia]|uniref:Uncharacterized protein n=1 Tax=Neurospora intermedia TaxID=5142 RepID=A0ABR3DCZ4_NEUIN